MGVLRFGVCVILLVGCGRSKAATVETPVVAVASVTASAPADAAVATAPVADASVDEPKTTPVDASGLTELDAITKAAKGCANPQKHGCDVVAERARNYVLAHCGADGIDPEYTFGWAARDPFPGGVPHGDQPEVWIDPVGHPKLVRVDEELYHESGWTMAEPRLSFVNDDTPGEQKRLAKLEAGLTAKSKTSHVELAVFYGNALVTTLSIYGKGSPPAAGGLAIGLRVDHPLCRRPQARVLPPDVQALADTVTVN